MPLIEVKESNRDLLAHETSGLSVGLSRGKTDPRDVFREINHYLNRRKLTDRQVAYLEGVKRQLVFREFARSALEVQKFKFPKGARGKNSREYKSMIAGDTGIPIIDACIRNLQQGLPHNRARLLLARWAIRNANLKPELVAEFYKQHLNDYSPVINTFNIVSASSGAVFGEPCYRTSNPVTAAKKLDPDNDFIKRCGFESQRPTDDALQALKLGTELWKRRWREARTTGDFIERRLWPTEDRDRGIYFVLDRIPARGTFGAYFRKFLQNEAEWLST